MKKRKVIKFREITRDQDERRKRHTRDRTILIPLDLQETKQHMVFVFASSLLQQTKIHITLEVARFFAEKLPQCSLPLLEPSSSS